MLALDFPIISLLRQNGSRAEIASDGAFGDMYNFKRDRGIGELPGFAEEYGDL